VPNLAPLFDDNFTTFLYDLMFSFAPAKLCVLVHPLWLCT
jgi:hypothetical protein